MYDKKSTTRFSDRVKDYVKYRPNYPNDIVNFLQKDFGLTSQHTVADIGAGTGISSRLFLNNDYTVIAVEPNAEMRQAALDDLMNFKKFSAIAGTAENTLLPDHSIDIIVVAQAFHWFDAIAVKKEFQRILKSNGLVVFIWNERLISSKFEKEYEELIVNYATDYMQIDHRNIDYESIKQFFAPNPVELKIFPNHQVFNFDGLKGRLTSSSYIPQPGNNGYVEMIANLQKLFDRHEQDKTIRITYDTKVYISALDK